MKKFYKIVASLLAVFMLLTSANFAVIAAELADAAPEEAPATTVAVALQNEGGELPTVGVLDGIDIDWENYVAESTGTKFTRDYKLGLSGEYDDVPSSGTEDRFNHVRASLPDEIPCFAPYTKAEIANTKTKFYVAPNGDDRNPGTIDEPFATPYRAVKAINNLASKQGGVTVYFREGTYSLTKSVTFTRDTSGVDENNLVFFSNYEDEKVTFTGTLAVSGSSFKKADDAKFKSKVPELAQPHIMSVNLKELGYSDFGTWSISTRPSLYVDGAQYTIARWPNGKNTSMAQYTGPGAQFGVKNKGYQGTASELGEAGSGSGGLEFKFSNSRPLKWENTGNIWMYGYWYAEWSQQHLQVVSFDASDMTVKAASGLTYGGKYVKGDTYYYYNIFEELDNPGEWYIDDKTGMLYIYPVNEIKDDTLVQIVTTNFNLISEQAAKYTVINGITFDMGNRAVYLINDSQYNIVQRCHIKNMTDYAITAESAMHCGFICNLIESNNSIRLYGADGNSMGIYVNPRSTGNFAQNNYCQHIQVGNGRGNIISHNMLNGASSMSLYVNGGGESIIEYNEVCAAPDQQLDAGCVYVNGSQNNYGQIIRYNYLNQQTPTMRSAPYGIYLDDMSSGMYVYGNVLRDGIMYLHGGQYNTVYNNLVVDAGESLNAMRNSNNYSLTASRWDGWILTGTRYTSGVPGVYSLYWMDRYPYIYEWHSRLIPHRYNFYSEGYDVTNDPEGEAVAAPQDNVYKNNVFINSNYNLDSATREIDRVAENNHVHASADEFNFEDYDFGVYNTDKDTWNSLCPGVEMIKPNHMYGIVYDPALIPSPMKLGEIKPQSPANQTDTGILTQGVVLKWGEVYGKSSYNVKLAKDPEFTDIVLEQEQQSESVALPNLEYDQTYYWTVSTNMWTNKFDQTPVTMPVAKFRTMSEDEAAIYVELDTTVLDANIGEMKKYIEKGLIVEEGSEAAKKQPEDMPLYKAGTIDALKVIVAEAESKLEEGFRLQRDVEAYNSQITRKYYTTLESNALPYTVSMGEGSHQFIEDGRLTPNATNLNPQYNGDTLIMDGVGANMIAGQILAVNSGATFKVNIKFDKLNQWSGIVMKGTSPVSGSFTSVVGYGVVFKSDIIELQRYPKTASEPSSIFVEVVNNDEIVRGGVPFDFESTVKTQEDGVHVICKVNGEVIIDYLDKNAPVEVLGPGYYGFMHNNANLMTTYTIATGEAGNTDDGFVSTVALKKAITNAEKFAASLTEGEAGEEPTYKVGSKAKIDAAVEAAKAALATVASKTDVTNAVEALEAVVEAVKVNDANECTFTIRQLDLSKWKLTSSLAAATIEENGDIIAIVPDETESTSYEWNTLLTSKQMMRFTLKYDKTGNWDAISTRKITSGLSPTQSRGYFFVIKDDLIEFQKYTANGQGTILATIENNNQIFKPATTHEVVVGSVNVEGGVLSKLIVDGETVLEYLDTEDPIYEQGYFSLYCHNKLGRKALGHIPEN